MHRPEAISARCVTTALWPVHTSLEEVIADESFTSDPNGARPGQPPWLSEGRRGRRGRKLAPDHAECAPGSGPDQGHYAAHSHLEPFHSRLRRLVRQVVRPVGRAERRQGEGGPHPAPGNPRADG